MKFVYNLCILATILPTFISCVDDDPDPCAGIAEEYWSFRDPYDEYAAEWEALSDEEKEATPLLVWLEQDPEKRWMKLAQFNAEHAGSCTALDRPEIMERYR